MGKPGWLRQGLAILAVFTYSVDVGSDIWVGIDLIKRMHFQFAASVFFWLLLPGFVFGWADFFNNTKPDDRSCEDILLAVFFPILIIPYTISQLIIAAIHIDDDTRL